MNAWSPTPSSPSSSDAQPGADSEPTRLDRQLQILDRLAEAGLNIVLALERQALRSSSPDPSADLAKPEDAAPEIPESETQPAANDLFQGDLALAYARAARAVRMSIALQSKLADDRRAAEEAAHQTARYREIDETPLRMARIERIVERVAMAEHDNEATIDRLVSEASERLDDGDLYGDVLARPASEIIDAICRDLGLVPDWPALAREAWAAEEIAGGKPGAPLAAVSKPPSPHFQPSPSHVLRPDRAAKPASINAVEGELAVRGPPSSA